MRPAALSIFALLAITAHAADYPTMAKPGDGSKGSKECYDKKTLDVINFRAKPVKDPKDAEDDAQLQKKADGWHFNYFEGEDVSFNDKGELCVTGKAKSCGKDINNVSSWRDTGVNGNVTHDTKLTYVPASDKNPVAYLLVEFLKPPPSKDVDKDVPYLRITGTNQTKDSSGNMNIELFNPSKKNQGGSVQVSSSADDKGAKLPDDTPAANKKSKSTNTSSEVSVSNDTKMKPCEAFGASGFDTTVAADDTFDKQKRQPEPDLGYQGSGAAAQGDPP